MSHKEVHKVHRTGWLRATVLGALLVTFWGALAMVLTAVVGRLTGLFSGPV